MLLKENINKKCNGNIDESHYLAVDVHYPENLHNLYRDLHLLPERMKNEKVEKLSENLHDKEELVIHKRNLKEELN